MRELAKDLWLITGFPRYAINCYVAGDVLIDAMTRLDAKRITKALSGRTISAHALTHAHPDHLGASHVVCTQLGVPYLVPERDVPAAEDPKLIKELQPSSPINSLFVGVMTKDGHPVDRVLHEGDEVGGFTVLDTPGHSAGHVSFWRESDRALILGDVLNNQHPLLGFPRGLRAPLNMLTPDPERNRESIRRLGELEPALVCFGHGPPHRDAAAFTAFCRSV
jgi:glyoxylase-like metal-dependent hydrolase (beta-lactamase superfamily II)